MDPDHQQQFRTVLEGLTAATGEGFFRALVRSLANVLDVRYSMVTECGWPAPERVRTLAFWKGDDFGDNFDYDVAGTPCETVIEKNEVLWQPRELQECFPRDKALAKLGAESYWGMPIVGESDRVIGHLAALDVGDMAEPADHEWIFQIFAARASAEIQRCQAERRLRESEERFRRTYEQAAVGMALVAPSGHWLRANRKLCEILGYSEDELRRRDFQSITHPDDLDKNLAHLRRALDGEIDSYSMEKRYIRKDGSVVWATLDVALVHGPGGEPQHFVSVVNDISARKRVEEALRQSEAKYRALVERVPAATYLAEPDVDSEPIYVSPHIQSMTGFTAAEWCVRPSLWRQRLHPDDQEEVLRNFTDSVAGDRPFVAEYRLLDKNDQIVWIHDEGRLLKNDAGEPVLFQGIMVNVTQERRAEDERRRTQKLESLGILAGGIAHDFNNLLMGIMGNITLARNECRSGSRVDERLNKAEKAAMRTRDLTQQLLTFAKGGAPIKQAASIAGAIRDTVAFSLTGSSVQADLSIPESLWPAEVDLGQMSQILENLVINATQAMPGGGKMWVSAVNAVVEAGHETCLAPGKYVRLTIGDEGCGIDPEHLSKIFDPYFTTKDGGSGLGLATSHSIIRRHGGSINVESTPDVGTTFQILLPAAEKESLRTTASSAGADRGSGRILVMDDEEIVRGAVEGMLRELGYEPVLARDGEQAVELYRQARKTAQPFDLVILDLTVPGGLGGRETMRRLLDVDPAVVGIASSGYSEDTVLARCTEYGFTARLAKPYGIEELRRLLDEVLVAKPQRRTQDD